MAEGTEGDVIQLDSNVEHIKIYGLQRSGTNYLAHLINTNFQKTKVLVNIGGWKHGTYAAPWILGREVHCLVVLKSPYAWLRSVYDYWGPNRQLNIGPDLRGTTFEQFVRNRVVLETQKGVPYLYRAANPIEYWNNMVFHWTSINIQEKKLCVIAYETLLNNFDATMLQIGDVFGLEPVSKDLEFENCNKQFVPSQEKTVSSNDYFTKTEYYMQKKYLRYYSPDLLQYMLGWLDHDLLKTIGYEAEAPPEC